MEKVIAIIAAHNEEGPIRNTLKILNEFKKKGIVHEIVVVNDGSTDRTVEEAKEVGAIVVSHKKQSGKRKVFCTGVRKAHEMGATTVLMLDADIMYFPEKSARKMITSVSDPRKCQMATAQQHEPNFHSNHKGEVKDPYSNAQRAINMVGLEPLIRGNKKWIDILEKGTKHKWGLEYALEQLIPKNKKTFLKDCIVATMPAFRDQHKYKIRRIGASTGLYGQQIRDRFYVDQVKRKRSKLARAKNAYRTSFLNKMRRKIKNKIRGR